MRTAILKGTLLTPDTMLSDYVLLAQNGVISSITREQPEADTVIDASGMWVVPGFIDVHVHGGEGHDTMDATPEAIHGMARFFARHGVTAYYPTTMTDSHERILKALQNVANCPQPDDGAQHLGVHVEGPYLNLKYKGAQPPDFFRPPNPNEYRAWVETGVVKLMTAAPEIEGAMGMIAELVKAGIEIAVGHTASTYAEIIKAADAGARQGTHTYNAMTGLHHREPGALGAVMVDARIFAQVISDGVHVHPAAVNLLVKAKEPARVMLITDAMRAAGIADGNYTLGAMPITVKDGIARTADGALAGSTVTMDAALRNVMTFSGLSLLEALPMATSTPAQAMGLGWKRGKLSPGLAADIVLLDSQLNVRLTMIGGRVVYDAR